MAAGFGAVILGTRGVPSRNQTDPSNPTADGGRKAQAFAHGGGTGEGWYTVARGDACVHFGI